ncbi:porin [Ensifer soli]|uniref:porin n=1 Tax=Ciceribacter sp. sgz301302 TaxID=3342379 RepID=UPI0035B979F6
MNIKSLLLGSAAALAAFSGAQAADAIVAAEPEPMEYVRVCDAFGTGYFYIPGTETCLKVGGYVRTQLNYDERGLIGNSDLQAYTRGYLTFDAKSDTEYGTLTGFIALQADTARDAFVDEAYIELGGLRVGYFYNWWDKGIVGETDELGSNLFNAARYVYDGGAFQAGVAVEELDGEFGTGGAKDNVGVSGIVTGTFGAVSIDGLASYSFDAEEAAFRALLSAGVGPGTFQLAAIYATGASDYYSTAEWTVAAAYEAKFDKFTITPAAQYFGDVAFVNNVDAWKVGLTVGYQITEGLSALATVNYTDIDRADDFTTGFLRLQRDF